MQASNGKALTIQELMVWFDAIQREYGPVTPVCFDLTIHREIAIVSGEIRTSIEGKTRVLLSDAREGME